MVIFLGLDPRSSGQLRPLLTADGHEIHVENENAAIALIRGSSAVFIGGAAESYLPLVRRLRALDAKLCLVVIARNADTQDWMDAIEAGATDYWPAPFEPSQVRMLIGPTAAATHA
jgi:DNA-binding response OmpR family regulator